MVRSILIAVLLAASFAVCSAQSKTIWKDVTYQEHGDMIYGTDGSVQRRVGDDIVTLVMPPPHPKRQHGVRVCLTYADNIRCSN
jgi:hypothetical protein